MLDAVQVVLYGKDRDKLVERYLPHQPGVPDHLPPAVTAHRGDWKLIRLFHEGDGETHAYHLYNPAEDLIETNNLAAAKPELVTELDALITTFLRDTAAVAPAPNPAWNPRVAKILQQGGWTISKDTCRTSWKPGSTETAAGMQADTWTVEDDRILAEIYEQRQRSKFRELPE